MAKLQITASSRLNMLKLEKQADALLRKAGYAPQTVKPMTPDTRKAERKRLRQGRKAERRRGRHRPDPEAFASASSSTCDELRLFDGG
jgi:hypothetical protein